jgi:hypothetical protein
LPALLEADISEDGDDACCDEEDRRRPEGEGKIELLNRDDLALPDVGEEDTSSMM